jgi:phosphoribosylformylglycinamidine cyclo-ligase
VFSKIYQLKYPEAFDPSVPLDLIFSGSKLLTDPVEDISLNVGKLVLSPTRTYAPIIKAILTEHQNQIHGMVHCSGGGQTKILHFIDQLKILKNNLFEVPLLFSLIQNESNTSWREMYQVFNMGHRFELYVPEEVADDLIEISESFNVHAQVVGHVEASAVKELVIQTPNGSFEYH